MTNGTNDLEQLCRACGLCCDGSLFGRARLAPAEVAAAKKHGLRVVANERSFEQPCSALVGRTCSIYELRPQACHAFTCELYARHARAGGPLDESLAIVGRVQTLLAELEKDGATPNGEEDDPRFVELVTLMKLFERAR